ncbi:MAG: C40 family peptidase [Planctomycetota bacterium]
MSAAALTLLCALARPASAEERQSAVLPSPVIQSPVIQSPVIQSQVVKSLRALGLPAPDSYASRVVTLDLSSIGVPSMGDAFGLPGVDVSGLLDNALSFIGVPYRFGGSTPATGFDCSGFVKYVFNKTFDLSLPRTAREMARSGMAVARGELQPGDLVFFNTRGSVNSHVGIYLGDSKFVHAPYSRARVRIDDLDEKYYRQRFNGARRVAALEVPAQPGRSPQATFKGAPIAPASVLPTPAPAPSTLIPAATAGG